MPAGRELTPKQQAFVENYLIDLNATQAAIRAGYSAKTAYSIGEENLRKPEIQGVIEQAKKEREQRTEITADRVLKELAKIAFTDIKDFMEFGPEEATVIDNESGEPVKLIRAAVQVKPSSQVDGSVLAEVSQTRDGIKVKPHDKMKALELIGRHLAMFTDKVDQSLTGELAIKHQASKLTDEELEGRIAELQK